jgi:hypothetical protein
MASEGPSLSENTLSGTCASIEGDGVAALCCAHLLVRSGIPFSMASQSAIRQPVILLGSQAASLLREACGAESLLDQGWRIDKRVVLWGKGQEPVTVAHDGIAISEEVLLQSMQAHLRPLPCPDEPAHTWKIATRRAAPAEEFFTYGERRAAAYQATLKDTADSTSCWIESTADGWLFLLPYSANRASLIVAGASQQEILRQSCLIGQRIEIPSKPSSTAPIAPRIARELCHDGLIFTGSAAMRFDPLCGEGAGHAVREAYLTVSVIRAVLRGEPVDALQRHYTGRLQQAFLRHLVICDSFYSSGGESSFWQEESAALRAGMREVSSAVQAAGPAQFRFRGLDLEAVSTSAAL